LNTAASFKRGLSAALISVIAAAAVSSAIPAVRFCTVTITSADKKVITITTEIADSDWLRAKGLMHRKLLDKNRGMIFVYPHEEYLTFWMKNTYIPLSIAYIGASGKINEIYDMKPIDTSVVYPAKLPARFALEVNQGWFRENRITPGCRVTFNGCLGQ